MLWVFEHHGNFWQKFDAQKCRLKFIIMNKGSKLSTAYPQIRNYQSSQQTSQPAMFVGSFGSYIL